MSRRRRYWAPPPVRVRWRRWWCGRRGHPDLRVLDDTIRDGWALTYCPSCRTDYMIDKGERLGT